MPNPTLTPGDNRKKEKNPGQRNSDQLFEGLSDVENTGTVNLDDFERNYNENADPTQEDENIKRVQQREDAGDTPDGGWKRNYNENPEQSSWNRPKLNKALAFAKKRGGIAGLIAVLGLGGGLMAGFLGPATMLINVMENFTISNDSSSTALERRFMNVFGNATQEGGDAFCTNSPNGLKSIKCRMGRISNHALIKLEKKGVVAYGDGIDLSKRTGYPAKNPTGYTFDLGNGETRDVRAADVVNFLGENPKMAYKVLGAGGAFNMRYKAWAGKHMTNKFFNKYKVKRDGGLANGADENRPLNANERLSDALTRLRDRIPGVEGYGNVKTLVEGRVKANMKTASKGGVPYMMAVGGCVGASTPKYIAAGVAAVELARLLPVVSDVILSPGSKQKGAGVDPASLFTSNDADVVGTLITEKTPRASDGRLTSATDSPYFLAAMGVNKNAPPVSTKFSPGYGILKDPTMAALFRVDDATEPSCNVIMSPAAMYSAMAVDTAATVALSSTVLGGILKVGVGIGAGLIIEQIAVHVAGQIADATIQSIAGNDNLGAAQGEELGDVLGISAMSFYSVGGMSRHLPTLTESQLAAYDQVKNENESFQREMAIASLSPFDVTSRYTFLGSIAHNANLAVMTSGASGGLFSTFKTLASLPIQSLSPSVYATSEAMCSYADEFGLEAGTYTPAINFAGLPCTGIVPEQAAMSTNEAIELMLYEEWLDESKEFPDSATIDDLLTSGYIKADTPLADFIGSCSSAETGDYLFNTVGCTVNTSPAGSAGVSEFGCITVEDGEICSSEVQFTDEDAVVPMPPVKNPRSLIAMSTFLLDLQAIQSINGEDETSSSSPLNTTIDSPEETVSTRGSTHRLEATDEHFGRILQRTYSNDEIAFTQKRFLSQRLEYS